MIGKDESGVTSRLLSLWKLSWGRRLMISLFGMLSLTQSSCFMQVLYPHLLKCIVSLRPALSGWVSQRKASSLHALSVGQCGKRAMADYTGWARKPGGVTIPLLGPMLILPSSMPNALIPRSCRDSQGPCLPIKGYHSLQAGPLKLPPFC